MFHVRHDFVAQCSSFVIFSYDGGASFKAAESTAFVHDGVKMTEYENEPFVVGDYKHNQIEFMHLTHHMWYTARPFPFQRRIYGYAVVSRPGKIFILGGCCDDNWSFVSLFQNDEWSQIGSLNQGRMNFMALTYGTDVMIIGGKSKDNKP